MQRILRERSNKRLLKIDIKRNKEMNCANGIKLFRRYETGEGVMRDVLFRYENIQTKIILERKTA